MTTGEIEERAVESRFKWSKIKREDRDGDS